MTLRIINNKTKKVVLVVKDIPNRGVHYTTREFSVTISTVPQSHPNPYENEVPFNSSTQSIKISEK